MHDSSVRAWGPPPVSDANARRPRTFQCRDTLWEGLEQIAGELECTVDYLVNDALKHYIRQRLTRHPQPEDAHAAPPFATGDLSPFRMGELQRAPFAPVPGPSLPLTPSGQYQVVAPPPAIRPPPPPLHLAPPPVPLAPLPARLTPPPLPPARPQLVTAPRPNPMPPPYPPPLPGRVPSLTPPYLHPPPPVPPTSQRALPPIPAGFAAPPQLTPALPLPPVPPAPPVLTVTYADRTAVVDRQGFVIGRGKAAGLAIKDPNISRQHAVIEQQGGLYFLVDMGSTNGTFVNGDRISRRAIADGDVAKICEHEVRFSFTRPAGHR